MSTSPRPCRRTVAAPTNGPSGAEPGCPTIGSSATQTTWGVGGRDPGARRGPAGGGRDGTRPDGLAPVGGENEGLPHRRGLRLPRVPYPAENEARPNQARALHL